MSKLNISFSNLKRIGAMSLALMTLSGCSNAVTNQNGNDSDYSGSYSDESFSDEINLIEIGAIDATTGKNIGGSTLEIRDENGDIVDKLVTEDDVLIFVELEPGKYTLIETIAPCGYESSSNVISFKVGSDKSAIIINKPQKKVKTR